MMTLYNEKKARSTKELMDAASTAHPLRHFRDSNGPDGYKIEYVGDKKDMETTLVAVHRALQMLIYAANENGWLEDKRGGWKNLYSLLVKHF
jgi:hypothetical protein